MKKNTVPPSRVIRALQRTGINAVRDGAVWRVSTGTSEASILLPDSLPLELKAVEQLLQFAAVNAGPLDAHTKVCKACATPDFHPGTIAPVGTIVATTPDMVIPHSIGTDINCGMRLLSTGFEQHVFDSNRTKIETALRSALLENARNVPLHSASFKALFEAGPNQCIDSIAKDGVWSSSDFDAMHADVALSYGLDKFSSSTDYVPEGLWSNKREVIRDPQLGTIGSGNHFVEVQVIDEVYDRHVAFEHGLKKGGVVVSIHSGSRDVGFYVGSRWMDAARNAWPATAKHPESKLYGLTGPLAEQYMHAMGAAARYAWLNRVTLGELVRNAIASVLGGGHLPLVIDVPHNVVLQENGLNVHRKGATPAHLGQLGLIPGSMGDFTYLVSGLGNAEWLSSSSHGAGRSVRRQAMRGVKPGRDDSAVSWRCVTLREERIVEEAPSAYKPIGPVISSQEEAGMIKSVAKLRPWATFKA